MQPISKPEIDKLVTDIKSALRNGSLQIYDLLQLMGNKENYTIDWLVKNGAILADNESERNRRFEEAIIGVVPDKSVNMDKLTPELKAEIEKLLKKNFPLELSVSISPTALQKKGSGTVAVSISWTCKVDGVTVTPTSVKVNGTAVTGTSFTGTASDTTNYKVDVEAEGRTASVTKTVTFVLPIYLFFSTTADYNTVSLSGEQSLATSLNYTNKSLSNGVSGDAYLWIVSPFTPKTVQSTTGLTIDVAGAVKGAKNGLSYWRSNDALGSGSWTLTIKS